MNKKEIEKYKANFVKVMLDYTSTGFKEYALNLGVPAEKIDELDINSRLAILNSLHLAKINLELNSLNVNLNRARDDDTIYKPTKSKPGTYIG